MRFNPDWEVLLQFDQAVPQPVIEEINSILFAPNPASEMLAQIEICVVLGSRNCEYKAVRAAELFGGNHGVIFIACGANSTLGGLPEAQVIRQVLSSRGVADERILTDEHSTDTIENLSHAEHLISDQFGDPSNLKIAVLSAGFHRLHVLASLPASLAHSSYINAYGPTTSIATWHTNAMGRAILLHELQRPSFARVRASHAPIART